jgi:hypothetical protein
MKSFIEEKETVNSRDYCHDDEGNKDINLKKTIEIIKENSNDQQNPNGN